MSVPRASISVNDNGTFGYDNLTVADLIEFPLNSPTFMMHSVASSATT